ncbi:hypothetical protein SmJEL517_g02911 [Synchytrium microbalum]|uniref:UBX domain-containing protein n=1 Tax=Synchytrium microbalum TaxID=1806994 RepID=A0A507C908_9FUNG|nr:uncharacterized protein SmJEL517_g02911 [Synchytrium microbalum]TPX34454.1 hypothetical protein SmJEL517_g02911 [Synchytrium microbalum]
MASMVNVELDGAPYKKVAIKTTPTMSLRQIADQAVDKLKLQDPGTYGLKYQKNTLDLSLSVRFANLAAGAKLTLIKTASAPGAVASEVSIALQVEDGGRLMAKFSPNVTFWHILVNFESTSNGSLNLTQKSEIPPKEKHGTLLGAVLELAKKNTPVYMMPVCIFMNKEYATIQDLKTNTLASAGLTSGNGVIRLLYRYSVMTLAQAQKEIEAPKQPKPVAVVPAPAVIPARSTSAAIPLPQPSSSSTTAFIPPPVAVTPIPSILSTPSIIPHPSESVPTPRSPIVAQPMSQPVVQPSAPTERQVEIAQPSAPIESQLEIVQPSAPTESQVDIAQPPASPDTMGNMMEVDTVPEAVKTAPEVETVSQLSETPESTGTLERDIRFFKPPPDNIIGPGRIELPDSFYELTAVELKLLLDSAKNRRIKEETQVLRTRAMREKETQLKTQKWPKTMIRVRFPDRTTLQAQFFSSEKLSALYSTVRDAVASPEREFTLHVTPPMKILSDHDESFWKSGLAPATLVYFAWRDGATTIGGPCLSSASAMKLQDYPLPKDVNVVVPMDVDQKPPAESNTTPAATSTENGTSGSAPSWSQPTSDNSATANTNNGNGWPDVTPPPSGDIGWGSGSSSNTATTWGGGRTLGEPPSRVPGTDDDDVDSQSMRSRRTTDTTKRPKWFKPFGK